MDVEKFLEAARIVRDSCRKIAECEKCPLQGTCARIPEKWPVPDRWPPEKGGVEHGTQA